MLTPRVLLLDCRKGPSWLWAKALNRYGYKTEVVHTLFDAQKRLGETMLYSVFIVIVSPISNELLTLIDYGVIRNPKMSVVASPPDRFYADGSLFKIIPNLRSQISLSIPTDDLNKIVEHYAPIPS